MPQARTPEQLIAQPLLYHSNYPDSWRTWAKAAGVSLPTAWKGAAGFDLVAYMLDAARAGMGVGLVARCLAETDLAAGRLVAPVDVVGYTGRGYFLCRPRHQTAHPAADAFSAWLQLQAGLSLKPG